MYNPDQLRQRVAWALHKIDVSSVLVLTRPSQMAPYMRILYDNAFGNYYDILYNVTLNPAMGLYLNMNTNTKTNPNENYAREIMQLFSIGTDLLNMDGTPQLDAGGTRFRPTTSRSIDQLKLVLTGWKIENNVAVRPRQPAGLDLRRLPQPDVLRRDQARHHGQGPVPGLPATTASRPRFRAIRPVTASSPTRSTHCSAIPTPGRTSRGS